MENISNAKIEKLETEIEKNRTRIAEYQEKLNEQEKLLTALEDLEIVARFRNQRGNEDLAAKIRNKKRNEPAPVITDSANKEKEEALHDTE